MEGFLGREKGQEHPEVAPSRGNKGAALLLFPAGVSVGTTPPPGEARSPATARYLGVTSALVI